MLLVSLPLQFAYFAHDYFTDYRIRAAARIDPINFREVARSLFAGEWGPIPRVYLGEALDDGVARWRFYLAKYGRDDVAGAHLDYRSAGAQHVERPPAVADDAGP